MADKSVSSRVLLAVLSAAVAVQAADDLTSILQSIADAQAQKYDCAIGIAVLSDTARAEVASGFSDQTPGAAVKANASTRYLWGSVTKVITGTALLRLHEEGRIPDLDASVSELVDPLLAKMHINSSVPAFNFSKLSDLWGPQADKISLRHLATMQSGLPDFDTARPSMGKPTDSFRAAALAAPSTDFPPLVLLGFPWVATGALKFAPGSRFDYSSTNFVLLGLALCAATPGCGSWDDYDQRSVLTAAVKARMADGVDFGAHGSPADYPRTAHGYDRTPYNGHNSSARPGGDFWRVHGAFSGWTASDVVMSARDAAALARAVYGPPQPPALAPAPVNPSGGLLSPASQRLMQSHANGSSERSTGFYTFATMDLGFQTGQCAFDPQTRAANCSKYGIAWGHLAATYGYDSTLMYFPALNLSLTVATNAETENQQQVQDAACVAYNRVKNYLLGEPVERCGIESSSFYAQCKCYAPGAPTPAPRPATKFKCVKLLKQCVPSVEGAQSHDECVNTCD